MMVAAQARRHRARAAQLTSRRSRWRWRWASRRRARRRRRDGIAGAASATASERRDCRHRRRRRACRRQAPSRRTRTRPAAADSRRGPATRRSARRAFDRRRLAQLAAAAQGLAGRCQSGAGHRVRTTRASESNADGSRRTNAIPAAVHSHVDFKAQLAPARCPHDPCLPRSRASPNWPTSTTCRLCRSTPTRARPASMRTVHHAAQAARAFVFLEDGSWYIGFWSDVPDSMTFVLRHDCARARPSAAGCTPVEASVVWSADVAGASAMPGSCLAPPRLHSRRQRMTSTG